MSNQLYHVKRLDARHVEYYSIPANADINQVLEKRGIYNYTTYIVEGSSSKASKTTGYSEPLSEVKADGSEA